MSIWPISVAWQIAFAVCLSIPLSPGVDGASQKKEPSAKELIERNAREKSPVWADGDVATFFYRGDADDVTLTVGGETKKLHRLPDSDVWTLTIERPGLAKGVFTYFLIPHKKGEPPFKRGQRLKPSSWRGPDAPPAPLVAKELKGIEKTFDVPSKALGGTRKVRVYLPPSHDRTRPTSVIYAADGMLNSDVLEPLILAGHVRPVMVIGVSSGGYLGDQSGKEPYDIKRDLRALEYLPGHDADRFKKHEAFFCEELAAWAQRELGASSDRKDKAVFGCSNGARFAVEMGVRHPDLFGSVFAFSVAGNRGAEPKKRENSSHFYLAAGMWEPGFHKITKAVDEQLEKQSIPVSFHSRYAGHDDAMWRDEFALDVQEAFRKPAN